MKLMTAGLAAFALAVLAGCNADNSAPDANNTAAMSDIANDAVAVGDNAAETAGDEVKPVDGAQPADPGVPADKPAADAPPADGAAGADKPTE